MFLEIDIILKILNEKHLYSCIKYIHNNPVKANLCMLMKEYKYSSYNEYLKEKRIINDESIELLFGKRRDYKKDFNFIHDIEYGDEYTFEDIKDKEITDLIKENEKKYNKNINELKQN